MTKGPRGICEGRGAPSGDSIPPRSDSDQPQPVEGPPAFPDFVVSRNRGAVYDLLLEGLDQRLLVRILSKNHGDRKKTARYLGVDDLTLERTLKRLRLSLHHGPPES